LRYWSLSSAFGRKRPREKWNPPTVYKSYVTHSMMLHGKMVSRILDGPGNTKEKRKMSGEGGLWVRYEVQRFVFRRDNCAVLGYYVASSGNSQPT